jgi:hypothetical protein
LFFLGTLVSSSNKTDCHDIIEIYLKVALTTVTLIPKIKQENVSAAKKKKIPVINYIKVVRIFLSRDQFDGVVREYKQWNMPHEGT